MLAILAAGAITAVGPTLAQTMRSLQKRTQVFDDLEVKGQDGDPVSGVYARVPKGLRGANRLAAMAAVALEECARSAGRAEVPLLLCAPDPKDLPYRPEPVLDEIVLRTSLHIDRRRSRVLARGRAGIGEALDSAAALLSDRRTLACAVGGVDTFIDTTRVKDLLKEGRIIVLDNSDGFVPGEGAAVLLLSSRTDVASLACLASVATAREPANRISGLPATGLGLQQAMTNALGQARLRMIDLGYLAHDCSGEQRPFDELSLTLARMGEQSGQLEQWGPATCVGEVGAAAGFLSLAMLASFQRERLLTQPGLAVFSCDGEERGAAVVVPSRR
jgi:3-oxoacyl-[acyl-carrier-protein] synthase-1